MNNLWTRVAPYAINFACHGVTIGPCWTARTEWFTGLTWKNHKFGANDHALYQQLYVEGAKYAGPRSLPEWTGPYNMSLAAMAGFGSQRVSHDMQVAMNVLRPDPANPTGIPHDPTDDLQQFTGSIFQEAARSAMVMFALKYNNPWKVSDLIPAGITRWRGQSVQATADGTGQWQADIVEFDGINPFNGTGVSPPPSVNYKYGRGSTTLSTYTVVGGVGRIKSQSSTTKHRFRTQDIGTYCVQIGNAGVTGYNGLWKLVAIDTEYRCWFEFPGGDLGTSGASIYNRHELPIMKAAEWTEEFIDMVDAAGAPCLIWLCPHQTHATGAENPTDESNQTFEKCYEDSVDPTDACFFDGVQGAVSPTAPNPPSTDTQLVYKYIMQQMATVDDFLGRILDKLDSVWPNDYYLIFTADQGIQQKEQDQWGNGGIKTAIWEGSRRSFCFVMGPGIEYMQFDRPTMHADLPATILDMLGDTTNHMHLRDGRSLLRVINPDDPAYDRVIPAYGGWKTISGEGYLGADGKKFVRAPGTTTSGKIYDWRLPSQGGDYESVEVDAVANGDSAARNAMMTALNAARFDFVTETNPFNDGRLVQ